MVEIEFSIIEDSPQDPETTARLLKPFEEQENVHVLIRSMSWETAWQELFTITVHGSGPDVSQIGSTWCNSLVEMNALRPFSPREVAELGGPGVFMPPCWQSAIMPGDPQVWTIPWYSYVYLIGYRRDLLNKAGIEEQTAFRTAQDLAKTIHHLETAGIEVPLAFPTFPYADLLHTAASWVWGAGGDIINDDGKHILINQPGALAGLQAFFEIQRGLSPAVRGLEIDRCIDLFVHGRAAMILVDDKSIQALPHHPATSGFAEHLGVAKPSRVPWFGGGNLVIWRYVQGFPAREQAAVALVHYLASCPAQIQHTQFNGTLPARVDVLQQLSLDPPGLVPALHEAITTGRHYKSVPLWQRVEFQLGQELIQVRAEVLADMTTDIGEILHNHLDPLVRRLDLVLGR